jgi:hypothetical protein
MSEKKVKSLRNLGKYWLHSFNHISSLLDIPKAPREFPDSLDIEVPDLKDSGMTIIVAISHQWIRESLLLGERLGYLEKNEKSQYKWKDDRFIEMTNHTLRPRVLNLEQCKAILEEVRKYDRPASQKIVKNTVSQTDFHPNVTKNKYRGYDPDTLDTAIKLLQEAGFVSVFKDYQEIGDRRKVNIISLVERQHKWQVDSTTGNYTCKTCDESISMDDADFRVRKFEYCAH